MEPMGYEMLFSRQQDRAMAYHKDPHQIGSIPGSPRVVRKNKQYPLCFTSMVHYGPLQNMLQALNMKKAGGFFGEPQAATGLPYLHCRILPLQPDQHPDSGRPPAQGALWRRRRPLATDRWDPGVEDWEPRPVAEGHMSIVGAPVGVMLIG